MAFPQDHPRTTALLKALLPPDVQLRSKTKVQAVINRASRHALLPPIYQLLTDREAELPKSATDKWKQHAINMAVWRTDLRRAFDILNPKNCRPFVLKGPPFSVQLFGSDTLRISSDIDLFIRPSKLQRTAEVLRQNGYSTINANEPRPWATNQYPVSDPNSGRRIEVHWLLAKPFVESPSPQTLRDNTVPVELGDGTLVRTLSPSFQYLQILFHFFHHGGFAKGLVDYAAWLDAFADQVEAQSRLKLATRYKLGGVRHWMLDTLKMLIPDALDEVQLPPSNRSNLSSLMAFVSSSAFQYQLRGETSKELRNVAAKFDSWIGHDQLRKLICTQLLDGRRTRVRTVLEGGVRSLLSGSTVDRWGERLESVGLLRRFGGLHYSADNQSNG